MATSKSVSSVGSAGLCCGCGTCVAVCPEDAVVLQETPAGLLVPEVLAEKCTECGRCRACCPGLGLRVRTPDGADAFAGSVRKAYVAYAASPDARRSGQSGGVVGALLHHLFDSGQITGALGVAFPSDGSLRPNAGMIVDSAGVASTQGSKYCPAPVVSALKGVSAEERIAFVGLPCQLHGVEKMRRTGRDEASAVGIRIGLFCDRVLTYSAIDRIALDMDVDLGEAVGFEYRSKARAGWPGEVCFTLRSGDRVYGPQELRRRIKQYATQPRCRVCFDKLNTFADIAVGDAWGIAESPEGASVVLARTQAGEALLRSAADAGAIRLVETTAESVFSAAGLEPLRRRFVAFRDAQRRATQSVPQFDGLEPYMGTPDAGERLLARQLTGIDSWVAASPSRDEAVRRIGRARTLHAPIHTLVHVMSRASERLRRAVATLRSGGRAR